MEILALITAVLAVIDFHLSTRPILLRGYIDMSSLGLLTSQALEASLYPLFLVLAHSVIRTPFFPPKSFLS